MIITELNNTNINDPDDSSINNAIIEKNPLSTARIYRFLKVLLFSVIAVFAIFFILYFSLYLIPEIQEMSVTNAQRHTNDLELKKDVIYKKQIAGLKKDIQKLSKKFNSLTPENPYIVINTTKNRFYLYRNRKMIRQGFCSSGSYILLMTEEAEKQWVFKTPKGRFWIHGKTTSPVWRRPDWSFVEEGLPIPSSNHPSRWEYGVLGDYALSIGDGYLIHGTIYKRFLGMPVTHGCIRLNDDDLETIYRTLDFGSKVYIY